MNIFKQIILAVCLSATCCIAILCSYNQLERKYQKLENKRVAYTQWLASVQNDTEGGGPRNIFARKLNQLNAGAKKLKKGVSKLAKSGKEGIK